MKNNINHRIRMLIILVAIFGGLSLMCLAGTASVVNTNGYEQLNK